MSDKANLKRQYKERTVEAGIYQIKNTVTGKILLGGTKNLHGPLNRHRFMLVMGSHRNTELQHDFNTYGADAFQFEILDRVKPSDDPAFSVELELARLEREWVAKLTPVGERGYNRSAEIRD